MADSDDDTLSQGCNLKQSWIIIQKIGSGGFGKIYSAIDVKTREKVAIKTESRKIARKVLHLEATILKRLQGFPHICRYYGSGHEEDFNFLVMSLLGKNLSELRKSRKNGNFTMPTVMLILLQVIDAIEVVHKGGIIHRDIKPSNFAMGLQKNDRRTVYILDFGLSKAFVKENCDDNSLLNGNIRPRAGFRGTVRYASLTAHDELEQGRSDDLWSIIYMTIEFIEGTLPWKLIKDKQKVAKVKRKSSVSSLTRSFPSEFSLFIEHVSSLGYLDTPNYGLLRNIVRGIMKKYKIDDTTPFDWEMPDESDDSYDSDDASSLTRELNAYDDNNAAAVYYNDKDEEGEEGEGKGEGGKDGEELTSFSSLTQNVNNHSIFPNISSLTNNSS